MEALLGRLWQEPHAVGRQEGLEEGEGQGPPLEGLAVGAVSVLMLLLLEREERAWANMELQSMERGAIGQGEEGEGEG